MKPGSMIAGLVGAALIAGLCSAAVAWAGHYEAPKYTLLETRAGLEVREYAPRIHAEVTVQGTQGESANKAFRILAAYIFGKNQPQERIGMTIPVGQQPQGGEQIGMTVPVGQQPGAVGEWVVWFVMPSRYALDTLPAPEDPRIRLREEPAHRAAVLPFRGRVRAGTFEARAAELLETVAAAGLSPVGEPTLAQYSDPRVPGFLRHNEVMVRLAD